MSTNKANYNNNDPYKSTTKKIAYMLPDGSIEQQQEPTSQ